MQKSKTASKNTNKQLRKTDMTTFYKMQKLVTAKKCNTHFVITERKKNIKTHENKQNTNIQASEMVMTETTTKPHLQQNQKASYKFNTRIFELANG